ncbi:MAG: hypothetical protein JWO63_600 [Frankiales bacterium]|nr:hypothetical protein [Frankiales bacterium]
MRCAELLIEAYGRIVEVVEAAVAGLSLDQLSFRPGPAEGGGNSIGWLIWHLSRVQDDHVADAAGQPQVWLADGYADRFDLPFAPAATGYGQGERDVAAVRVSAELLLEYHRAVHARTVAYLAGLSEQDLDRVVDPSWDPPVTLGVRLVSVISDDLQHAGQAAYVRGLL